MAFESVRPLPHVQPIQPIQPVQIKPQVPQAPSLPVKWSVGLVAVASAKPQRHFQRFRARKAEAPQAPQARADTLDALTVTEVYKLLKGAPSPQHALQLAARLRRASREGKRTRDGRSLDAEIVDDALDILLENTADTEHSPEAEGRQQEKQKFDAHRIDIQNGDAEEKEEEQEEQEEREETEDNSGGRQSPPRWSAGVGSEDRETHEVPYELWEQVVSRKFNVVDRVWKAPTSASLPKVPSMREDAMVPESSWLRLPHIAVNGMTNCGKSTLINHLIRWTYAAKASSVPGRTNSIDFYCVNNRFVLVDLPGYPDPEELAHQGVLKKWEAHWQDLVFTYLQMCADGHYDLRLMLQLQQTKRRPSRACRMFVDELRAKDLPLLLILTKDDQLKKPNEERNYYATQIKKTLGLEGQHLHFTAKHALEMSRRSKKHVQRWIRTAVTAESRVEVQQTLQEAWRSRIICETRKTPEQMREKKELWKARYKKLREERKQRKKALTSEELSVDIG
ncbi:unnamed protein product [Effrenium voratum]|uniref:G domain-containing protein n=1 Tax=Effrenium voratum TaxID=2562239 RepID=A0AA36J7M7_9DINO|nr:unnamed protein product [Effrenium voratum]